MTAIPLTLPGADTAGEIESFAHDLAGLERRYALLWHGMPTTAPCLGDPVTRRRQRTHARAARALVGRLATETERYPESERLRPAWRRRVEEEVRRFGEECLGWPAGYRRLLFADAYYDSTVAFARAARAFDPELEADEIGQALRNVWIMNSLQMLLDRPVELSPAIFAYSMLYPETDNFLDDPEVGAADKRSFNRLLGARLAGTPVEPRGARLARVFRLVARIERQWPRAEYREVHESLLAIHRGQTRSLDQHGTRTALSEDDLLSISIAKGGASVLADGYLTAGRLTPDEADFCFGYGVFLQFLDDLQDLDTDRAAGHATLFSTAPAGAPLDALASRVYHLMNRVVTGSRRFSDPRHADSKDLILRNSVLLFVGAVAAHRAHFSKPFVRALETRWPLRFKAMLDIQARARKRFGKSLAKLKESRGVDTALDLL